MIKKPLFDNVYNQILPSFYLVPSFQPWDHEKFVLQVPILWVIWGWKIADLAKNWTLILVWKVLKQHKFSIVFWNFPEFLLLLEHLPAMSTPYLFFRLLLFCTFHNFFSACFYNALHQLINTKALVILSIHMLQSSNLATVFVVRGLRLVQRIWILFHCKESQEFSFPNWPWGFTT